MLSEEYLWNVPDSVVKIWEELEEWIVKDICSRIMSAELYDYNKIPGTALWRMQLLNESGMHYSDMISVIAKVTKKSEEEVKKLFEESGIKNLENEEGIFRDQGIEPLNLMNNAVLKSILQDSYERTNGELRNFSRTTANASQKLLIDTLDKAYFEVTSGAKSYTQAIKDAIETASKDSAEVTYPSGHKDSIETAVRRAVLTGINQGAGKTSLEQARELGAEYVVVSAHVGARTSEDPIANHAGWQGKVYKIDGEDKDYPNLERSTGFPSNPLGLCGYNCRHKIHAYFLGESNPFADVVKDQQFSDTQYELSQKQRRREREIRKTKKQLIAYETAIENCKDERTKFELQLEYDKLADRLRRQNKKYKEFCEENAEFGIRSEQERLKTLNWNRENADKARSGASRYKSEKENSKIKPDNANTVINSNVIESVDYRKRIDKLGENVEVHRSIWNSSKDILNHRSGTEYEDLAFIDSSTGKVKLNKDYNVHFRAKPNKPMVEMLKASEPYSIIAIHNHPNSSAPSFGDIKTAIVRKYKYGLVMCHNGNIFKYRIVGNVNDINAIAYLDRLSRLIYNKGRITDFDAEYQNVIQELLRSGIELEMI